MAETQILIALGEMENAVLDDGSQVDVSGKASERTLPGKLTPLMQQYWDVKQVHEDKVVLFRMGDFFEMFHRDAEIAAPVLGIALTSRNKKSADDTPMCGVPHHSVANSINKLLSHGFKVAICDQIEDPKFAKGLVKRAVTRILSPGMVYDPDTLDAFKANYLASYDEQSLSFLDTTTGEAFYFLLKDPKHRLRLLSSLEPVELVLSSEHANSQPLKLEFELVRTVHADCASLVLDLPESARRLLSYAVSMQGPGVLDTLSPFERRELVDRMELGATVIRHLEIFSTYKGDAKGSLFHAVNRCKTSIGARLLRSWLQFPLTNQVVLEKRHDRIERWLQAGEQLKNVRLVLSRLGDVQRRLAKIGSPSVNPRDLEVLARSLQAGLEVSQISAQAVGTQWDAKLIQSAQDLARDIENTLVDEAPVQVKNGGLIRKGVSPELDELIELSTNSQALILNLEAKERELTGISSLKIRFNNVFGYYIEITHTHKEKIPAHRYERKQTLANAERFITPELAELESKVLSAQSKRNELEHRYFTELVTRTLAQTQKLLRLSALWAEIDVASGLANLALENSFCRPQFVPGGNLRLSASRHPVIEQILPVPFVANTIEMCRGGCLLLTGPNMAGKSTLMRQVAIAAVLAQAGCFVPASKAELPIFDRIFTRIGASDFLSEGLSTFMVEMKETAEMLEFATENSLVVLDEVGRGTSTYDGLSLAQAILEYLLENRRAMTLFATHYQELTELSSTYPELQNAHMRIHEPIANATQGRSAAAPNITFLYQLAPGPANKSYGIHVGRLAGLPASVTRRASQVLRKLENHGKLETAEGAKQMTLMSLLERSVDLVEPVREPEREPGEPLVPHPELEGLVRDITGLDLSRITPLEALNQIAKWQQSLS